MRRTETSWHLAIGTILLAAAATVCVTAIASTQVAASSTIDIVGPAGSGDFGGKVHVLPNGNFVVVDVLFDLPGKADVGAVYLYDGKTNQLISTLRGSTAGDMVGGRGIELVGTSNFLVLSQNWSNGAAARAGAVTWVDGSVGLNGEVSPANSLVGSHTDDSNPLVVTHLTNGNYVIGWILWDNGATANAGAATWGNGNAGVVGPVSAANSLVGSHIDDRVGSVTALTNGNYVASATSWDNGAVADVGAAMWANGATGVTGLITPANALIGGAANNSVGGAFALKNGNYVVGSKLWDNGAVADVGAATWRSGAGAAPGVVSPANSLIGSKTGDNIGALIVPLSDGNYVATSQFWDNGAITDVGSATWGNGATGTTGTVSPANSFVGAATSDGFGISPVALLNGNYVIRTPLWENGAVFNAGAATWRQGGAPSPGTPSAAISLVGTTANDEVGFDVVVLSNGNYAVDNLVWDNGAVVDAGSVTWANGAGGTVGAVSAANSLVGTQPIERVGSFVGALTNGDYVVGSERYDFGSNLDAGALTWRPGTGPAPAIVSDANSLVGHNTGDLVGEYELALPNGDYLAPTRLWNNGEMLDTGALTFGNGTTGIAGEITSANSLLGTKAGDTMGDSADLIADGTWYAISPGFDNGSIVDAGAVTFGVTSGMVGSVSSANSVFGTSAGEGTHLEVALEGTTARRAYVVGRSQVNTVTLFTPTEYVPLTPARLADTRPTFNTADGIAAGGGLRDGGSTLELPVAGRGGVAADAVAVSLNVTAVDAGGNGFVTIHPCGETRPTASSLNMTVGSTVPNAVITKIGAAGKVCIFTSQPTHLVVDVNGYFPTTTSFHSANPARLLETRSGLTTIDGVQQGGGKNAAGGVIELQVTGRAGVPADASSVALNVTITEADGPGFATVFPCGITPPLASNLNYVAGSDVANLTVAKIGAGGKVCILTSQATHVVADLTGFFPAITGYTPLSPARLLETRPGLATVDGQANGAGARAAGTVTEIQVTGRAGVPPNAATVVMNVTVTEAGGAGFVTVYPCGIEPPLASNLNFVAGSTVPNAAIVKVGADGKVCLFNSQPTHLVADVSGYFVG